MPKKGNFVPKDVLPNDRDDLQKSAREVFLSESWCWECVKQEAPVVDPCPHGRTRKPLVHRETRIIGGTIEFAKMRS